jgi:hypothetical protein
VVLVAMLLVLMVAVLHGSSGFVFAQPACHAQVSSCWNAHNMHHQLHVVRQFCPFTLGVLKAWNLLA